ncbi:LysR family transcriptional regulator [Phyllobacterium brassicacearum]|uniref:LysR family transcriptional regulator n=1 Tax=Phyllobacterium brassicacearum TaxID=314235 RepID=A0A2P7BJT6_9HYPH|nr:LysR family transcriptional regulator [Phyllobacterium brassicacearum]PSH66714.1 LysR family transcriptional regulator [Phyllobacterium brassicacearum]TDQ32037.1 LysR family transcriptional regulator [Phyllobacterium brassicacearum]
MDRFQEMQIFARIVERRSFSRAADDLNMPRATVTNAMKRMEERLGARLLDRTTRLVNPTLDGQAYYSRCLRLLADMEEAEGSFRNSAPKGLLRVNLQGTLARHFVIPALPAFLGRYPDIELSIGDGDRLVDLVREGIDCVLRAGDLEDSSMVGRRIARMQQVTCASPDYLARHGEPRHWTDFAGHMAVNYVSSATGRPYPLEFSTGEGLKLVTLPGLVSVTGADIYTASAIAGLGFIQVPRYRVADELAEGKLCVVLSEYAPSPMSVSVLYPQNRQLSSRVRAFADWLTKIFSQVPG